MADSWGGVEVIKALFTFDNGLTYEIDSAYKADESSGIQQCALNENEAITSGNPIGIMSSNTLSLEVFDKNNYLSPLNDRSPYYGFMRSGVRIDLSVSYDGGDSWGNFGVFYTNSWRTPYIDGYNGLSVITACDRLQYLGNSLIPKLPIYAGVEIKDLIKNVFLALGLTEDEFAIDSSLNLNLLFGVTPGAKVRDFLNTVCQALIARVIIDRDGVIRIIPADKSYGNYYVAREDVIIDASAYYNTNNIYNKVKIIYDKIGSTSVETITTMRGVTLKPGLNKLQNIRFSKKVLAITGIHIEAMSEKLEQGDFVSMNIDSWTSYQSGIDLNVNNWLSEDIPTESITIEGVVINSIEATVEVPIEEADTKIGNTLEIRNEFIQDEESATRIATQAADFLYRSSYMLELNTLLDASVMVGDTVEVIATALHMHETFKVVNCVTSFGYNYTKKLTLMKE